MKMEKLITNELGSGDNFSLKIIKLQGICEDNSKKVYIQANVHGAEVQGNAVIYHLIEALRNNLSLIQGEIVLVPQANPLGSNQKVGTWTYGRFNPITGDNWNRMYKDVLKNEEALNTLAKEHKDDATTSKKLKKLLKEKIQAMKQSLSSYGPNENSIHFLNLQELASDADIVLDLHTGPIATNYLYVPAFLEEESKHLGFNHMLIIPNEFGTAMDEATFMPWVHLQKALKEHEIDYKIPFSSYTVELEGEELIDLERAKIEASKICQYLVYKKVLTKNPFSTPTVGDQYYCHLKDYKTYYAPRGGLVNYTKKVGELVKKDTTLFEILNFNDLDNLVTPYKAYKDCLVINHNTSSNIRDGMELYQVMENYWKID
ncbi:succinylglutamate desuccinylase/aspartoacylase family protein [Bacteriovorax sp. BSW11_IV]|uniref:succinylglutamate desuccinylase/aspartoacylase family protein n=1 Tax=Bacteriovorax sp. BSW11_IV TaxID=1353529 RepID=UPI00038A2810|nr:succinylglutamate desuccinylase/aspartoacylase family protein [Bacteriovorax sp. BSW11_IV]EQC43656.1 succinylglutamate desuccinylase/aspartoacylase family protein [Bacteriovorax sp. BSW11_IV]